MLPLKKQLITNELLEAFIKQIAEPFSAIRKLKELKNLTDNIADNVQRIPSTEQDMKNDWYSACTFLVSQLIDSKIINFIQIGPDCYPHLEEIWLKDVKKLKAYFIWENNDKGSIKRNYYEACKEFRQLLINKKNASLEDFEKVKTYLETYYLTNGKIDENKYGTENLINTKANRIWESTGNPDKNENWFRAKLYVNMFYENIIPAVMENDRDKILTILKAFQFSKMPEHRYLIINCFEAAIAIAFLNKNILQEILNKPEFFQYSMIPVKDWPENIEVLSGSKGKIRYDRDRKEITYEGIIEPKEKETLMGKVKKNEHKIAIENLFHFSSLAPIEETIL